MKPTAEQRPVDLHFEEYNAVYQRMPLKPVAYLSIVLLLFGLMAVIWALPFPELSFLGKYKGYINWASFLIAAGIYYYLRLSPLVSYLLLLLLLAFSYIIIVLEQWQKQGGSPLLAVGAIVLFMGLLGQLLVLNQAKAQKTWRLMALAPGWSAVNFFRKLKLKY
jgi:hypothetical protein